MKETTKGYIAASVYAVIIGLSFLSVKVAVKDSNPFDISAHRFLIALIAYLPILYKNRNVFSFTIQDARVLFLIGILYPVAFFLFQAFGLQTATSSQAGVLNALSPLVILIFSAFLLKEKITKKQVLYTVLSVSGVLLIFLTQGVIASKDSMIGLLFLMLSTIIFALYNILVRKFKSDYTVTQFSFTSILLGFIVFNLISLGTHIGNGNLESYFTPLSKPTYLLAVLYLGVLASLGSVMLNSFVLKRIPVAKVGVFGNLATMVSIVAGVIILGEPVSVYLIMGAIIIIVGVVQVNKDKV